MLASSASKVFSFPKILEPILAELPQRDLLLAQRVNRQRASLVTNSLLLQRILDSHPSQICPQLQKILPIEINPLVAEFFPAFTALDTMNDDYIPETDEDRHGITGDQKIRKQTWYISEQRRKVFLRPEAFWRRMFVSPRLGRMDVRLDGCGCNQRPLKEDCVAGTAISTTALERAWDLSGMR
ncbi:hypothetical protein BJX68DRAFT_270763 [Aspergillus pseudodeflectus]|uniref:F-box domain-containing protein n=1 Tax=Aspergillus pseudodeflectus TaxID=176178 RepID=A0ABR4JQK6_9EURO